MPNGDNAVDRDECCAKPVWGCSRMLSVLGSQCLSNCNSPTVALSGHLWLDKASPVTSRDFWRGKTQVERWTIVKDSTSMSEISVTAFGEKNWGELGELNCSHHDRYSKCLQSSDQVHKPVIYSSSYTYKVE